MGNIRIATTWDSIPPVVYDGDEAISTRVLEKNHRDTREVALALREYIDALPLDVVARLPVMPGIDRDFVDEVLDRPI